MISKRYNGSLIPKEIIELKECITYNDKLNKMHPDFGPNQINFDNVLNGYRCKAYRGLESKDLEWRGKYCNKRHAFLLQREGFCITIVIPIGHMKSL